MTEQAKWRKFLQPIVPNQSQENVGTHFTIASFIKIPSGYEAIPDFRIQYQSNDSTTIKLRSVGVIKITSSCAQAVAVFSQCEVLECFGGFDGDQSNITTYQSVFQLCKKLKRVGIPLDFTSVTGIQAAAAFNSCYVLENTPIENLTDKVTNLQNFMSNNRAVSVIPVNQMDTSKVTSFQSAFQGMRKLEVIPDLDVSSATNVQRMFRYCYNVKYGILEMYNKLVARGAAITNHSECFTYCGRDTEEGRAALAQIPASWGGTAAG